MLNSDKNAIIMLSIVLVIMLFIYEIVQVKHNNNFANITNQQYVIDNICQLDIVSYDILKLNTHENVFVYKFNSLTSKYVITDYGLVPRYSQLSIKLDSVFINQN